MIFSTERLSHAYIADGSLAEMIATAAVCSGSGNKPCMNCKHCVKASRRIHTDIAYVERLPDRREITVDQIRELKKDIIVVPGEASMKVYIINDAELMNRNAQNALLQMLEEPPSHAVFILKTGNTSQLLPTVRSRCVELAPDAAPGGVAQSTAELAAGFFTAIENGDAALATFMFRLDKLDKEDFAAFLEAARELACGMMRLAGGCSATVSGHIVSLAERLLAKGGDMLDANVNTGHISGYICASLMGIK